MDGKSGGDANGAKELADTGEEESRFCGQRIGSFRLAVLHAGRRILAGGAQRHLFTFIPHDFSSSFGLVLCCPSPQLCR